MNKKFVSVEYVMYRDDRTRKYFENMMRSSYNHNRVICQNGKLMVDPNYASFIRFEIEELYFKALEIANNPHKLAKALAQDNNLYTSNALYLYFRYGSFKQYEKAIVVQKMLLEFIEASDKKAI